MARRKTDRYVARMDMTLQGVKVHKGQLISPTGQGVNERVMFADNSRWTYRYDGDGTYRCDTDGCPLEFDSETNLFRHRLLAHAAERDARLRAEQEAAQARADAEARGETIGGHPVVKEKGGPGGTVPYVELPLGR